MFNIFFFIGVIGLLIFVTVAHPVHTILSLIVVAASVSGVCFISNAEFLGFLLLVIYVGAIAVLFLFVVMMIAVNLLFIDNFNPLNDSLGFIGLGLLSQVIFFFNIQRSISFIDYNNWAASLITETNLTLFNSVLYGGFLNSILIGSGLLLLISMIGSIFLTVQDYTTKKSQLISNQLDRSFAIFNNGHHLLKYIYNKK